MKIESIKKEGKNKYLLKFEDNTSLKVYDKVILNNHLLFKKDISYELLQKIEKENEKEDIYYQTLKFISKKMRSKQEIIEFLRKKDVPESDEKRIINQLESSKFINDEMYVRAYIQDHIYLTSDGPKKIKEYLLSNNISESLIDKYLDEIDEDDIKQKLEKIVLKKIKNNTNKSTYLLKQKIVYDAVLLGYDKKMIEDIIERNIDKNNSLVVNKEYEKLKRKLFSKFEGEQLEKQIFYKLRQKGFSEEEIQSITK